MQRYTISGFTIPQVTILAGALMAALGLSFYGFTDYLTALFPTLFGIILMIAGAISVSRPGLNALAMHLVIKNAGPHCSRNHIFDRAFRLLI